MANITMYLTPQARYVFDKFAAQFNMSYGRAFGYIYCQYKGIPIDPDNKALLPKTFEEVNASVVQAQSQTNESKRKVPPKVLEARNILAGIDPGKLPYGQALCFALPVHLEGAFSSDVREEMEAGGAGTRGSYAKKVFDIFFPASYLGDLSEPLEQMFSRLKKEYWPGDLPDYQTLEDVLGFPTCAVMDHKDIRKAYSDYVLRTYNDM